MDTARTALPPSTLLRAEPVPIQSASDPYPVGLTLLLAMLVALAVIIGIVFYIAGQMPV
jgi:hypothetical protein